MPEELSNAAIRLDIHCYFQKIKIEKKILQRSLVPVLYITALKIKKKKKLNRNKANQFVVFC